MLHAFELGMLNDEDRRAFQIHLFDCDHCFERAKQFDPTAELMRSDSDIPGIPRRIVDEHPESTTSPSRRRFWPTVIPTSIVAAAVIILLVLKPWQIEIRPTEDVVAAENRVAVLYFENLSDPVDAQRLGEITASLLTADLSESRFLQVVSSQRLYDIRQRLGKDASELTDRTTATEVANEAGARWMITGQILQQEPQLSVSTEIVEVESGNLIASQQVTGDKDEDVFALVDRLTVQVKNDLSLPLAARDEQDRRVADVTTHSPLAYRFYLEGVVNYLRYYNTEAAESFRKALAEDSSFAMVYYYLSLIDDQTLIDRAVEHLDRARRSDTHFIRSRAALLANNIDLAIRELQQVLEENPDDKEAHFRIGVCYSVRLEFDMAVRYYRNAVDIDPLYKTAYNQMAYTFNWMGDLEQSIQAIDMYISLAPEEANPYDSRGDIYTSNARLELAIESYAQALEVKPDFWTSLYKLGRNYLFIGDFETADSCFHALAGCDDPSWRSQGLAALAYVPLSEGRFDDAIRILDEGIAAMATDGEDYVLFHQLKAITYTEIDDLPSVLSELEKTVQINQRRAPNNRVYSQHMLAHFLARTGDIQRAEEVTETMWGNIVTANDTDRYWYAEASVDWFKGNTEEAITGFEKAAEDSVIPYTPAHCMLASAYMEAGRFSDAIDVLNGMLSKDFTETRAYYAAWTAKAHYFIGVAHEELGRPSRAIDEYELFLERWKHAASGIAIVDDARERLKRLTERP
jgi:pentatricopeptide repeat protein